MLSLPIAAYRIGIICALSKELKAVRAIFDEIHETLKSQDVNDHNSYVLGRIGKHNVVAAGLPAGVYGTTSAATVGRDMLRTFTQLRFGLLVGIGGGIPNIKAKRDIRLGDVVVSHPDAGHGGLVQYDLGKLLDSGQFVRKGMLNKPPQTLLTALTNLQATSDDNSIAQQLMIISQNNPALKDKGFHHQGQDMDHLHCTICDATKWWWVLWIFITWLWPLLRCELCINGRVKRSQRHSTTPSIHYGLIVSGNTLLKSAAKRDALARDPGALCVEMEAAGLDDFPCLVIRGICDYADTYKNDVWQEYAALTAAAFVKEFLRYVSPQVAKVEEPVQEVLGQFDEHFQRQHEHTTKQQEYNRKQELHYQDDRYRDCHRVFGTSDYERQKNINPAAVSGTCRWALDHARYRDWSTSTGNDLLWISADPGCGKSVLSRSLVDDWLPSLVPSDTTRTFSTSYTICYFFFKDNDEQSSLATALCSILHQLFSQQPELIDHAMSAFGKHEQGDLRKRVHELWRILESAASDVDTRPIICVLDALDECRDLDRHLLIQLLCHFYRDSKVKSESQGCFKWLVTSRPHDDIQGYFGKIPPDLPSIRLRGEDENDSIKDEINLVIKQRMSELGRQLQLSEVKRDEVARQLQEMDNRTYLWLHLVIENIEVAFRRSARPNQVKISSLPKSVHQAYEDILRRIVDEEEKQYAKIVLTIIVGARRPLTVAEMALAFDVATLPTAPYSLADMTVDASTMGSKIRNWCGLFVFINHNRLYLIHQTAKEFLLDHTDELGSSFGDWKHCLRPSQVDRQMATICVYFLCLAEFNIAPGIEESGDRDTWLYNVVAKLLANEDDIDVTDNELPAHNTFFSFAAEHWAEYVRLTEANIDEDIQNSIRMLYDMKSQRYKRWTNIMWQITGYSWRHSEMGDVHLASFNGHNQALIHILNTNSKKLNKIGPFGHTPLYWAAWFGYQETVEILLAQPDIDIGLYSKSSDSSTSPLSAAIEKGNHEIVDLLLAHPKVDVNSGAPLSTAARCGHNDIVERLLTYPDIDVNLREPLSMAASNGHKEIVELLLARSDVDVNCGKPLAGAARRGFGETLTLLLARSDVGINIGMPLQEAAMNGHAIVTKLLLAYPTTDVNLGEPLRWASYKGHEEITKLLLTHPVVDVNLGQSLRVATQSAHRGVVRLLLTHPKLNVNDGGSLTIAAYDGHEEIVEQLLAQPSIDVNQGEPLACAVEKGHIGIVKLLLAHPNIDVNHGEPLKQAVLRDLSEIAVLLRAHPNIKIDEEELNALAARNDNQKIEKTSWPKPSPRTPLKDGRFPSAGRVHEDMIARLIARQKRRRMDIGDQVMQRDQTNLPRRRRHRTDSSAELVVSKPDQNTSILTGDDDQAEIGIS